MGCASSKVSKREILYGSDTPLPTQRYLSDPAARHVKFETPSRTGKRPSRSAGKPKPVQAARPTETFEAYAKRGIIRQSAIFPEGVKSKRTENRNHRKRLGGIEAYTGGHALV